MNKPPCGCRPAFLGRGVRMWKGYSCLLLLSVIVIIFIVQVIFWHNRTSYVKLNRCPSSKLVYRRDVDKEKVVNNRTLKVPQCEVIHVGLKCLTTAEIYYCSVQIKSILMFTQSVLTFHILTTRQSYRVVKTLMDTWELQHVGVEYYFTFQESFAVNYFLQFPPADVGTLVVLRPQTYFSIDIEKILHKSHQPIDSTPLVQVIDSMYHTLHNMPQVSYNEKSFPHSFDGVIIHLSLLRSRPFCESVVGKTMVEIRPDYLFVYQRRCNTTLEEKKTLNDLVQVKKLPRVEISGLLDPKKIEEYLWPEWYHQVLATSGDWVRFREVQADCAHMYVKPDAKLPEEEEGHCSNYQYQSCSSRRVHLYFNTISSAAAKHQPNIRSRHSPGSQLIKANGTQDITLVTQLQYNRMHSLDNLIDSWEGPIQVVLYLSDAESQQLRKQLDCEGGDKLRSNVFYHVVYKRHTYNPINVLRNIGLNETSTDYVFVIDVDFVPMPGSYTKLMDIVHYLDTYNKTNRAVIVPTFETTHENYKVPDNKRDFLRHLHAGIVEPYHQGKKWNFKAGHKPHKYQTWFSTSHPYQILWQEKFEPYFMMPTADSPLFEEILLERMMDKFPYSLEVHLKGYKFFVLPDVFMVHLPHPKSASYDWSEETYFASCTKLYYKSIKEKLLGIYEPKKTVP